jgi:hypothetical protein
MMVATVRKAWLSATTVPSAVSMGHTRRAALAFTTMDRNIGRRRETWRILLSVYVSRVAAPGVSVATNHTAPTLGGTMDASKRLLEQAEQEYAKLKTALR